LPTFVTVDSRKCGVMQIRKISRESIECLSSIQLQQQIFVENIGNCLMKSKV